MFNLGGVEVELTNLRDTSAYTFRNILRSLTDKPITILRKIEVEFDKYGCDMVLSINVDNKIYTEEVKDMSVGKNIFSAVESLCHLMMIHLGHKEEMTNTRYYWVTKVMVKIAMRRVIIEQVLVGKLNKSFLDKIDNQRMIIDSL